MRRSESWCISVREFRYDTSRGRNIGCKNGNPSWRRHLDPTSSHRGRSVSPRGPDTYTPTSLSPYQRGQKSNWERHSYPRYFQTHRPHRIDFVSETEYSPSTQPLLFRSGESVRTSLIMKVFCPDLYLFSETSGEEVVTVVSKSDPYLSCSLGTEKPPWTDHIHGPQLKVENLNSSPLVQDRVYSIWRWF